MPSHMAKLYQLAYDTSLLQAEVTTMLCTLSLILYVSCMRSETASSGIFSQCKLWILLNSHAFLQICFNNNMNYGVLIKGY